MRALLTMVRFLSVVITTSIQKPSLPSTDSFPTMYISIVLVFAGVAEVVVLRYWAPLPTTGLKALAMSGFLNRSMPIWADAVVATKRQIASTVRPRQQRFMAFSLRTASDSSGIGPDPIQKHAFLIPVSRRRSNDRAEENAKRCAEGTTRTLALRRDRSRRREVREPWHPGPPRARPAEWSQKPSPA